MIAGAVVPGFSDVILSSREVSAAAGRVTLGFWNALAKCSLTAEAGMLRGVWVGRVTEVYIQAGAIMPLPSSAVENLAGLALQAATEDALAEAIAERISLRLGHHAHVR